MSSRSTRKKRRYKQLVEIKRSHVHIMELIARYIDMRSVSFYEDSGTQQIYDLIPEELINNDVSHISESSSSALLGALWPNGAGSFRLDRHRSISDSQEIKNFFKEVVNPVMLDAMDNHENGLLLALEEAISEWVNYGVTSVFIKDNTDEEYSKPVTYSCWDVKDNYIDENSDKFVDTVYRLRRMDIRTIVQEYGLENVSKKVKLAYENELYEDKINVLITIEPREKDEQTTEGNLGMPIETLHMEYDTGKILFESGYAEFPVPTTRYKKKPDEVWGRGAGGQAMPEIIELNAIWEALTLQFEKYLDPPIGVLDDGRLGGGDLDTSPGGINVFSVDSFTSGTNPVFQLLQSSEPSAAIALTEKLVQSITQHFMLDRLLDLNNQTEMTLGEANIRNSLRSDSLRKVYARITAELFIPIINRTFNILFRKGYFGVIQGSAMELDFILEGREYTYLPDEIVMAIVQDREFYQINFISPAARMLQIEEADGIMTVMKVATEAAGAFPQALDRFNIDDMLVRLSTILGVSVDVLNSTQVVMAIREQRAQAQSEAAQLEQAREVSEIERNQAQAATTIDNVAA